MAGGRGSAHVGLVLLCMIILQSCETANAAIFTVGGRTGWSFNIAGWPKGKRFRAGDTLVFSYIPVIHNVVRVSKAGYNTCTVPRGSKVFRTGKDRIKLLKGPNFFICSLPGHCKAGMKITINAL